MCKKQQRGRAILADTDALQASIAGRVLPRPGSRTVVLSNPWQSCDLSRDNACGVFPLRADGRAHGLGDLRQAGEILVTGFITNSWTLRAGCGSIVFSARTLPEHPLVSSHGGVPPTFGAVGAPLSAAPVIHRALSTTNGPSVWDHSCSSHPPMEYSSCDLSRRKPMSPYRTPKPPCEQLS